MWLFILFSNAHAHRSKIDGKNWEITEKRITFFKMATGTHLIKGVCLQVLAKNCAKVQACT